MTFHPPHILESAAPPVRSRIGLRLRRSLAVFAAALVVAGPAIGEPVAANAVVPTITTHTDRQILVADNPITELTNENGAFPWTTRLVSQEFGDPFYRFDSTTVYHPIFPVKIGSSYQYLEVNAQTSSKGGTGSATDPAWIMQESTSLTEEVPGLSFAHKQSLTLGTEYVRSDITVSNASSRDWEVAPGVFGDCYFGQSDVGTNAISPGKIDCIPRDPIGSERISLITVTPGARFVGGGYLGALHAIERGDELPNGCVDFSGTLIPCDSPDIDNAFGTSWHETIPAGESRTFTYYTSYAEDVSTVALQGGVGPETTDVGIADEFEVTVTASNSGTGDEAHAVAELELPEGLEYVSAAGHGTVSADGRSWSIGSIPTGTTREVTLTLRAVAAGTHEVAITEFATTGINVTPCNPENPAPCGTSSLVTVTANASLDRSTIEATPAQLVADGTSPATITVTLLDALGNPVVKAGDTVTLEATLGELSEVTPNGDGTFTAVLTSGRPGTSTITGTVNGKALIAQPQVAFTAGVTTAATSSLSVSEGPRDADGTDAHRVTIALNDERDHPVPGLASSISLGLDPAEGAALSAVTESATPGVYEATVTATRAGEFTLTGQAHFGLLGTRGLSVIPGSPATLNFVAGAAAAANSELTLSTGTKVAGSEQHTATIMTRDAFDNPVAATVELDTELEVAGSTTVTTAADGTATVTLGSTRAGAFPVAATLGGTEITGSPGTVSFGAGAPSVGVDGTSTVTITDGAVEANGEAQHRVTTTIRDAFGNPVSGATVEVIVDGPVLDAASGTTGDDGVWSTTLTSTTAGSFAVVATFGPTAIGVAPVIAEFVRGAASAAHSSWVVTPDTAVVADGEQTFTATLTIRDKQNSPADGETPGVILPVGVTLISGPTATNAQGVSTATFASTIAGSYPIGAVLGADRIGTVQDVTFVAGAPSLGAEGASTLTTSDGDAVVGADTHEATATVTDAHGNPVSGTEVRFSAEHGAQLDPATATTNAEGVATTTIASETAGDARISATVEGVPLQGSPRSVRFVAGAASAEHSSWTVTPGGTVVANGVDVYTGTVTVVDRFGNPVAGQVVDFAAAKSVAVGMAPFVSNSSGIVNVAFSSTVVGDSIAAALIGDAPVGDRADLQFIAGPASTETSTVEIDRDVLEANGTDQGVVTVTLRDAHGNLVADTDGTVDITASRGDLSAVANEGEGRHTATVTSESSGESILGFTINEEYADANAVTTFVATPSAPKLQPSNGTSVTGVADPGNTVSLWDEAGTLLGTGVAGEDGSFTIELSPVMGHDTRIVAIAEDTHGFHSPEAELRVDATAPDAPRLDVSNGKSVAGGVIAPGDAVTIVDADGKPVPGEVTVNEDGSFVFVPETPLTEGQNVSVVVTDPAGNSSQPVPVVVDTTAPDAITVQPSDGKTIVGAGVQEDAKVTIVDADGKPIPGEVTVNEDGSFVFVPETPLTEGQDVSVVVTDPAGNASQPVPVVVDTTAPDTPRLDVSNGKSVAGGVIAPGDAVTIVDADGKPVPGEVTVNEDGSFVFVPETPLTEGQDVSVVVTDSAGNSSQPVPVVVDTTAPDAPQLDVSNGKSVTGGVIAPGDTLVFVDAAGTAIPGTVTVHSDGTFRFVPDTALGEGDDVFAVVTDPAGNSSAPVKVVIDAIPPKSPELDVTDGSVATGCAEPGSTVIIRDAAGTAIGTGVAGEDCRFSITLRPKPQSGTNISVEAVDRAGNVSQLGQVRVGLPTVTVAHAERRAGDAQIAVGQGFQPGEAVTGTLRSAPVDLGILIADARGEVTFDFTLPERIEQGRHTVTLSGERSGAAKASFAVVAVTAPEPAPVLSVAGLPVTGGTLGVAAALGVILTLGGALLVLRRRAAERAAGAAQL
ncbi:invasin domain 3-containing protein [Leucobacter chromiireducens]|nr:invasin domain 3-containing protein [Leucobacter chromiireducens]